MTTTVSAPPPTAELEAAASRLRVRGPDPTASLTGPCCQAVKESAIYEHPYFCTAAVGHAGPHIASDGELVRSFWPVQP